MNFDLENIKTTEFGIGRKTDNEPIFETVPVEPDVRNNLKECASDTWKKMCSIAPPQLYDPSNVTENDRYLCLPLDDPMAVIYHNLYHANNLSRNNTLSNNPDDIFCYFARFIDDTDKRLTAIRRTTQFRVIKKKNKIIRWMDGTLKFVKDPLFKLDPLFDVLVDSEQVHVLHPIGFEVVGNLKEFVLGAAETNAQNIQREMEFVDMTPVIEYAIAHIRAAKYLASIQSRRWAQGITENDLKRACNESNVNIQEINGRIDVSGDIMGFLEILDRRRYNVRLIEDQTEQFRAASRHKINSS